MNKMNKQMVVCMTGFTNNPQQIYYQQIIINLNMRFSRSLVQQTSILIVNDITTQKYKIAKIYLKQVKCVNINWLLVCKQQNKIIQTKQYEIKQIFYNLNIYIFGYYEENYNIIQQKIKQNGGTCKYIQKQQLNQIIKQQQIKILLINQIYYQSIQKYLIEIIYPIVYIDWLNYSINSNICKYPYDYAINQIYLNRKDSITHLKKMKSKLDYFLNQNIYFNNNILQKQIIYLGDIDPILKKVLSKLIIIYGGFYLEELNPVVTHIVTQPTDEIEFTFFLSYGLLTQIVRVQWLLDIVYFGKIMPDSDYLIRSFKKNMLKKSDEKDEQKSLILSPQQDNSNTFKATISLPLNLYDFFKPKTKARNFSNIFNGKYFYLQSSQRNETQMRHLSSEISKHGGKIFHSRRQIKGNICYYILKDGSSCNDLIQNLKNQIKNGKTLIQPASYRWVNQCISKIDFIDIFKYKSFIYKPLPLKLPIYGFHRIIFDVLGNFQFPKERLKQLYNQLGSLKNKPNKSEITHCLCGEKYNQMDRYHEIKRENKKVVFLDWKWLIDCTNIGKIIDINNYLLPNIDTNQKVKNRQIQ